MAVLHDNTSRIQGLLSDISNLPKDRYEEGLAEGYDNGYETGHDNGYDSGYAAGNAYGYESGHTEGVKQGYADGYEQGEFAATQEKQEMIDTIITGGEGTVKELESNVTSLRRYALDYADFVTIRLPEATGTANYAIANCTYLENVYLPKATSLTQYSFQNCTKLQRLDFPLVKSISNDVFSGCSKLVTLILRSSVMCTLSNADSFTNTPIAKETGYIYVPAELVDTYKAATNWATYADQIRAIEDYPDICGV